jgi:glycosyltransferase involved in cell wall biosynthesis
MNIAVIIPAYNEEQTITQVIQCFAKELPSSKIIVVNNNSTDQTEKISNEFIQNNEINGIVLSEERKGKANALKKAFRTIDSDLYITVDGDMTYDAKEIHKLLEIQNKNNAEIVVGNRFGYGHYQSKNKRPFHNFGNALVKIIINKLYRSDVKDVMSGYRILTKNFIQNYPILINGFEIETDMTLHALENKIKIFETPINYYDRPNGSFSKLNTVRDGIKVIFTIFKLIFIYRPFYFLTLIAIFNFCLGILSSLPVFYDWYKYQYIYRVPLALLSVGFILSSIICFFSGLILFYIKRLNEMNIEIGVNKRNVENVID